MENVREIADMLGYICVIGSGIATVGVCIAAHYACKEIEEKKKKKKETVSEGQLEDALRDYSNKGMMTMTKYNPPYPIVNPAQMKPRDQIRLVPEEQLDPLTGAELSNLRAGISYYFTIADTPQNRENFNFKVLYFQMVAYKEGWPFKPENFQVVYIPSGDSRFPQGGDQSRILEFNKEAANKQVPIGNLPHRISAGSRLGFTIDEEADSATQMRPEEADDLGAKVIRLFNR